MNEDEVEFGSDFGIEERDDELEQRLQQDHLYYNQNDNDDRNDMDGQEEQDHTTEENEEVDADEILEQNRRELMKIAQ